MSTVARVRVTRKIGRPRKEMAAIWEEQENVRAIVDELEEMVCRMHSINRFLLARAKESGHPHLHEDLR